MKHSILAMLILFLVASSASAQLKEDAKSLKGLKGIKVSVSFRPDPGAESTRPALLKMLQSEAENKVRQAGIPLLRYADETEPAGKPHLHLFITLVRPGVIAYAPPIAIETTFSQRVRLARDPRKEIDAVTWETHTGAHSTVSDEAVLRVLKSQLDEFIKAYHSANPKLSSVPG